MTAAPLLDLGLDPVRPSDFYSLTGKRHPCAGCRPLNPGSKLCHCSVCHATFTTVTMFDRHRPDLAGCLDPADAGLVPSTRSDGVWCQPGRAEQDDRDPQIGGHRS